MATAFLIDPALTNYSGHHAAIITGLAHTALVHGQGVQIIAHREASVASIEGHDVAKVFSGTFYNAAPADRVEAQVVLRRWQREFRDELGLCLAQVSSADCIHLAHAALLTLNGMAAWASGIPSHLRPRLVVYFVSLPPEMDEFSVALGSQHHLVCAIDRLRLLFGSRFELVGITPGSCAHFEARNCGPALYLPYMALRKPLVPLVRPPAGHAPLIVIAGHFGAKKGIDLVLPAIQRLADDGLDVRWVVAGKTYDRDAVAVGALASQVRASDQVTVARDADGLVDYDEWISSADLIVLPYSPVDYEQRCSWVAEEAEALGIPYVAPKVQFSLDAAAHGAAVQFD